jgi:hypothetical protein
LRADGQHKARNESAPRAKLDRHTPAIASVDARHRGGYAKVFFRALR